MGVFLSFLEFLGEVLGFFFGGLVALVGAAFGAEGIFGGRHRRWFEVRLDNADNV